MAPTNNSRRMIPKDRFSTVFSSFKTQNYHDPSSRGPGTHTIRTIAWNPTGTLVATGNFDRTLRIWNPERTQVKYSTELRGHTGSIEKVVFNPTKESELASCSSDGTVRFWDVRSKACVKKVEVGGVSDGAFSMCWSADGREVIVGKKNDDIVPISISYPTANDPDVVMSNVNNTPLKGSTASGPHAEYTIHPAQRQSIPTNAATFSHHVPAASDSNPEYDLLLTSAYGTVSLASYKPKQNPPAIELLNTLHAHTSSCSPLSFSPNGHYLAVGGADALISLWDTTDWLCRRTLSSPSSGSIRDISWSWDGRFVVGASDEFGSGAGGGQNQLEIFHAETGDSVGAVPVKDGFGIPAVAWHPSRYVLAYSVTDNAGLRIMSGGAAW